jgi:hypothetical protein
VKKLTGKPRRRWKENIKMDLMKIWWEDEDWTNVAEEMNRRRAVVETVMNLRVA